ncbi:MAG: hypothetical protein QM214_01325 [Bacillota bacterium]|jgi:ABC-2 type transport system permease protein|nr:hypothetical protein [Bacillota bacterium]HHU43289.1 hypothetical protein [Clostridiales bacterium]
MKNIITMFRHEFRSRFDLGKKASPKAWSVFFLSATVSLLMYALFLTIIFFITNMLLTGRIEMNYEFLSLATALSMLIQLLASSGALVKSLYFDADNELLLRFPVDGLEIFVAKSAFVFIRNILISLMLGLPFYIFYGITLRLGAGFYIKAVIIAIYISILPFCAANLISAPVMHVVNSVKNKFGLILGILIVLIVLGFSVYMLILKGVLEYMQTQQSAIFSQEVLKTFKTWAARLVPFTFYANILYGKSVFLSLLITGVLSFALGFCSFYLAKHSYYPTILKSLEREKSAFRKKTKNKVRPVFFSLLKTEYLVIFRSFNYSFQYLAMAITAPFMVYFCNDLASNIGDTSVGGRIIPGLTLLVINIFTTIIVSFASTSISRNGNTFYFTKIMPVSYKYQILVKMTLYFIVAALSALVSCTVVGIVFSGEKYGFNVGIVDILSIFAVTVFIIITLTSWAIMADLRSPTFEVNNDGELVQANKNVSLSLIGGSAISVLFGLFTMIFSYIPLKIGDLTLIDGINHVYLCLIGLSFIMAAVSCLLLFLRLDKKYHKLTP